MNTESNEEIKHIIDMMIKDKDFRRSLVVDSPRLFFGAYMCNYITCPFAPFHFEMFRLQEDQKNKTIVIMAARNSAKSTIMNTSFALWSILGKPQKKFVVILGATVPSAKKLFTDLCDELRDNHLLRDDLQPFDVGDSEFGPVLILSKYNAQITFASAEQSIRGIKHGPHRPDLIIADDIETDDSVRTIEGRDKIYNWIIKNVLPAGDSEKTQFVLLGTLLHEDSIMMRFKKEIEAKTRDGVYREYPLIDASGTIMWKGRYPDMDSVEKVRKYIGNDTAFTQEFLLRIVSGAERAIHPEWIQREESPQPTLANKYRGTYIGIDPAASLNMKACCTAIVAVRVFGWSKDTKIYVLPFPINEKMDFPTIMQKATALSDMHNRAKIYVEDAGTQKWLVQQLVAAGYNTEGIRPEGGKKHERLAATGPYIKEGRVRFAPNGNQELIMQIVNFGNEHYMDLADAFSMLVTEIMNSSDGYSPFPEPRKRPEPGEDDDGSRPITYGILKKKF